MKLNEAAAVRCALFRGVAPEELDRMLDELNAVQKSFAAGEAVLRAGEPAGRMGVLLSGRAQVIREEYDGNRTIVTDLNPGDLFAEAFACAAGEKGTLPVTVLSVAESAVLLLDCPAHTPLAGNLLAELAEKNLLLSRRLGHLSKRGTREKVLSYLGEAASAAGSARFAIPFSRQELADYLCVERSALSAVLSRLRREGVLDYRKNRFTLRTGR